MKVFWSWQADLDPRLHHYLVRDALKDACDHIAQADDVEDADRPEVDHDTTGVVGTPDIVTTILRKIEDAAVFVADVTPVGQTVPSENQPNTTAARMPAVKHLQNPNVMSELGYADHALGQDRIVLVANQARYPSPEALPFDWRHRRGPVLYNLPDGATGSERQAARRQLATELAHRIGPVLSTVTATRPTALSLLTREPDAADPAVWDGAAGGITFNESGLYDERKAARLPAGPRLYVRIVPEHWTPPNRATLAERMSRHDARLWIRGGAGSSGAGGEGAVAANGIRTQEDGSYLAGGITQWFAGNGEIWAVDTTAFGSDETGGYFAYAAQFPHLARFFRSAIKAIRTFAPEGTIEVEFGATGLMDTGFPGEVRSLRTPALSDRASVRATATTWTAERRNELLLRFWNALLDAYGLRPAASLEDFERVAAVQLLRNDEED